LLKHIFDQQRSFNDLPPEERFRLLLAYGSEFYNERQQLFAFFGESKHRKMPVAIVELIAGIYDDVFARDFGVAVKRTGEDAGQFDSPGIRFTCAVVDELDLLRHFGGNRRTLPRKIGNLWQSNAEIRNPELRALNRITFSHDFFSSKPSPKR
jgi:hypothetical protein